MNIKLVAEKTFNLLKGFGFEVSSYNKEGDLVIDPMEATRFACESPNILVRIDPTDKHLSLKTGTPGEAIEKIRPMLKELAQDYLLDFDYSVFDKQIKPKGEKVDVAKKSKEEIQMSEEINILKKLAGLEENTKDNCTACDKDMADCNCELCDDCDAKGCDNCDDGKIAEASIDEVGMPLKNPPGSKLKFGQDKNELLGFSPEETAYYKTLNILHAEGQLEIVDPVTNRPERPESLDPDIGRIAYNDFHKKGETDPVSAYAQASAKLQMRGYRSGDFSEQDNQMEGVAHPYLKDFPGWSWTTNLKPNMDAQDGFDAFVKAIIDHRGNQGTGGYTADNIAKMDVDSQGKAIKGIHHQELEATWGKGLEMHGWTILNGLLKMQDAFDVPAPRSNMESVTEASLGKMTGSRKSSYQPLADNVKIIVRHNKDVNEEVRGARSRNIHSILIQRGEEKFKMAENNLSAARAMARHLHNGGETFDTIGEAITDMSKEFGKLKEFVNYVRKANLVNEANQEFVTLAMENINNIKTTFKRLSGVKSYANAVESVTDYNNVELLQDDLDLESKFTETHFDDKVANVMDSLKAMTSRRNSFESKITKAIELESFAGLKDMLAEDDLMEFESINQQLGHKVSSLGNTAKDETLGNYLHSISSKLNAGGQLNQFEYGAVKSCLLSAGQHNVQSAPMTASESYEAFMDRFVD